MSPICFPSPLSIFEKLIENGRKKSVNPYNNNNRRCRTESKKTFHIIMIRGKGVSICFLLLLRLHVCQFIALLFSSLTVASFF